MAVKTKTSREKTAKRGKARPYHHGDLRAKLIEAAEALILERGVDGFSLREVARRAGVSPAAPAHHFGDTRGLLSEVALLGFSEFGKALADADRAAGPDPSRRLHAQGLAYVTFALNRPARFGLMFRSTKFDPEYKGLRPTSAAAFQCLERAIRDATGSPPTGELSGDAMGLLIANWSIVHGFAHLALGGEMDPPARAHGGKDAILRIFLPLMLKYLPVADVRK
jgi:AcrR family transcriptional regulator